MEYAESTRASATRRCPLHASPATWDRQPLILGKLETLNPGGSVKDRIGLPMIEAAERAGPAEAGRHDRRAHLGQHRPRPGHRRRAEGLSLHLRHGRQAVVREAGPAARLRRRGRALPDQRRARVARELLLGRPRLARDIPGAFQPDQYSNPANPAAHEQTTGPEIWRQTEGRITHLVVASGTGGTISGAGRYLKAQNPAIQVVGGDPEGSVLSGDTAAAVPDRGHRRGLLPRHLRPGRRRPLGARVGPRRLRHGPPDHPRGGHPRRRVVGHGAGRGADRGARADGRRSRTPRARR
jgi:cystathionine beta-synthase